MCLFVDTCVGSDHLINMRACGFRSNGDYAALPFPSDTCSCMLSQASCVDDERQLRQRLADRYEPEAEAMPAAPEATAPIEVKLSGRRPKPSVDVATSRRRILRSDPSARRDVFASLD